MREAVRDRRSAARRAVGVGLVTVVVAWLAVNFLLDRTPAFRDLEWVRHAEAARQASAGRPLFAVLGTSRASLGVSPRHLGLPDGTADPFVYNFARGYAAHIDAHVHLRRLLTDGPRPSGVIIEILPGVLADRAWADRVVYQPRQLSTAEAAAAAGLADHSLTWLRRWTAVRAAAVNEYRPDLRDWRRVFGRVPPLGSGLRGWAPHPGPDPLPPLRREKAYAQARQDWAGTLGDWHIEPSWGRAVRATLQRCRAEGLPVALFFMPESPEFRSWYQPDGLTDARRHVAALATEYETAFWDCTEWATESDTFDGHHLTAAGSERFSRRFGRECVVPWLETVTGRSPR